MINYGELPPLVAYFLAFILVAIVSLFPALFSAIVNYSVKQFGIEAILFAPLIWVTTEFLRLNVAGVGWNALGYSQGFHSILIWPAKYGGVSLISALIVLSSSAIVLILYKRSKLTIAISSICLLLCLIVPVIGTLTIKEIPPPKEAIDVIAVQVVAPVGVPQNELVSSLTQQIGMSLLAVKELREEKSLAKEQDQIILVAWPEAPFSFNYDEDENWPRIFGQFTQENKIYLLINAVTATKDKTGDYNSVVLINPNGERVGQYNKIHLLPFGEYVPMRGYLPLIDRIPALAGDYKSDNKYSTIDLAGVSIGTSICFESVFPDITREMSRAGAQTFINVANDGWFGQTPISRQHLAHLVMRAVETNRPTLRVTNVGISAYISANGQIKDETPVFERAVRKWKIDKTAQKQPLTFYSRFGDVFAFACLLTSLLLILAGFRKNRSK
jgi:apolipoprotein N-acyltransferase